jgi:prepilin-type N-terminal cleavage/methylation domain-containing protein
MSRTRIDGRTGGHTLMELVLVLVVLGIVATLAYPRLAAPVRRLQMEWTLNQLSRDVFYARMLAVRGARRVEVRFETAGADACVAGYRIVVRGEAEREARRVRTRVPPAGPCLRKNGPNPVVFTSRGRPTWNHSFWLREGSAADSMTMTQLGRLQRWP